MNPRSLVVRAAAAGWALLPVRVRRFVMSRYPSPAFRVGVLAIVISPDGRVLLLRHRFRAGKPWGLPGGWLEPGETPLDGVRRELREEIALDVEPEALELVTAVSRGRRPHVELFYRLRASVPAVPANVEFDDHGLFAADALPRDMVELHRAIVEDACRG